MLSVGLIVGKKSTVETLFKPFFYLKGKIEHFAVVSSNIIWNGFFLSCEMYIVSMR